MSFFPESSPGYHTAFGHSSSFIPSGPQSNVSPSFLVLMILTVLQSTGQILPRTFLHWHFSCLTGIVYLEEGSWLHKSADMDVIPLSLQGQAEGLWGENTSVGKFPESIECSLELRSPRDTCLTLSRRPLGGGAFI